MAQTTLKVSMDADLKQQFDVFCSEMGMSASVAVNLFAHAVLRERRIPFEIAPSERQGTNEYYNSEGELVREGVVIPKGEENDPFYSTKNLKVLNQSIEDMAAGKGLIVKTIEELEAMEYA